jgi:hypothetical protein
MSGNADFDGWTDIYHNPSYQSEYGWDWPGWKAGVTAGNLTRFGEGIVGIYWESAHQGEKKDNATNDVRIDAIFSEVNSPRDIIKDIIDTYAGKPFIDQNFDMTEFNTELAPLPNIGICLDKQEDVYALIEKIQKGSILGFQFMGKYDVFTARLDNPNRPQRSDIGTINSDDILNLDEIEVDFNADLYATYTDIMYSKRWYTEKDESEYLHEVNKSLRQDILDIHRLEKAYEDESLLISQNDAALKGAIILEDFSQIRPVISGIKLFGLKWFDLRIYDIITVDFVLHGDIVDSMPSNVVQLIQFIEQEEVITDWDTDEDDEILVMEPEIKPVEKNRRDFIGKMRCQILSREIDPNTGIVTISVRKRDRSAFLGSTYG